MSDLHEHRMIPDHAIPPYAWHYKCAVEGCNYETDSSKVPSDNKDTELARLRAELEWLRSGAQEVERERDEAITQVAILVEDQTVCAEDDTGLPADRQAIRRAIEEKARALLDRLHELEKEPIITLPDGRNVSIGKLVELYLKSADRLQRAGAVAEAARLFEQKLAKVEGAIKTAFMIQQIHGLPYHGENYGEEIVRLRKALAALEEGKA